ncbi:MAG: hypothetical protein D6679_10485 [Candidatus Hydrogenedentota bacterium]|nr:MAG: hypothetical protein D6679_10485 [Candidatus Hydrogenedentota bacterium]
MRAAWRGIITPFMKRLLLDLSTGFPTLTFIGGTALAEFYLGHRYSEDLDFASPSLAAIDHLEGPLEALLKGKGLSLSVSFPIRGAVVVYVKDPDSGDSVKIEFSTNPHIVESEVLVIDGVRIPSAEHLADLKWRAFPRQKIKDVFDLASLRAAGVAQPWPPAVTFAAPALAAAQRMLAGWAASLPEKPGWFPGTDARWEEKVGEMTTFLEEFSNEAVRYLTAHNRVADQTGTASGAARDSRRQRLPRSPRQGVPGSNPKKREGNIS